MLIPGLFHDIKLILTDVKLMISNGGIFNSFLYGYPWKRDTFAAA